MTEHELKTRLVSLAGREAQQERLVNDLIANMIDLDIEEFESVLDNFILTRGIDKAINQVIFPFLHRIGILWLTNHIHPAQEHLVTNVIRQKLLVGIEGTLTPRPSGKLVLLFLPEGEHHELGLLYVYYLLKTHGARVLYLGANLPVRDVEFVCQAKRPDFLYTHLTGIAGSFSLDKFLGYITQRTGVPLVISGEIARAQLRKVPNGVDFRRSIAEVQEFITAL
jgi:methanogenic corrinoid protein MtbC1